MLQKGSLNYLAKEVFLPNMLFSHSLNLSTSQLFVFDRNNWYWDKKNVSKTFLYTFLHSWVSSIYHCRIDYWFEPLLCTSIGSSCDNDLDTIHNFVNCIYLYLDQDETIFEEFSLLVFSVTNYSIKTKSNPNAFYFEYGTSNMLESMAVLHYNKLHFRFLRL